MSEAKILYVCRKMKPYLTDGEEGELCRTLPQQIQDLGREIRAFMPRFGNINDRRNQLHEVIRLSGMNIPIDQTEYQLIIKVASITVARMQIYFIDNEDLFHRRNTYMDDSGVMYEDNDERSMFYASGVLETVSKLRWSPDVVHCFDWFTAVMPAFVKKKYNDNPLFENTKIVLSLYGQEFDGELCREFGRKMIGDNITKEEVEFLNNPTYDNVIKFALQYTDGVVISSDNLSTDLLSHIDSLAIPVLKIENNNNDANLYAEFYDKVLGK